MNRTDLSATRSIELLKNLKKTGVECAKQEKQLTRDIDSRLYAANRKYREALDGNQAEFVIKTEETAALFKNQEEQIKGIYETRRIRVQRAYGVIWRSLPKRARDEKQRWMGDLQLRHFHEDRRLAADLESIEARHSVFFATLSEQRTILHGLNRRARRCFRGFSPLLRMLANADGKGSPDDWEDADQERLYNDLLAKIKQAGERLDSFRLLPAALFFSFAPLPLLFLLLAILWAVSFWFFSNGLVFWGITACLFALAGGAMILYRKALKTCFQPGTEAIHAIHETERLAAACNKASESKRDQECALRKEEHQRIRAGILEQWNKADSVEVEFENAARQKLKEQGTRVHARIDELLQEKIGRMASQRATQLEQIQLSSQEKKRAIEETHEMELVRIRNEESTRWNGIEEEWRSKITPVYRDIAERTQAAAVKFPAWEGRWIETWAPPADFEPCAKFGALEIESSSLDAIFPKSPRLATPEPGRVSVPVALTFPDQGSLLFETTGAAGDVIIGSLNNIILRILAGTPPGKIEFTIMDPVGLGQNFAGLMHLADYEENLINKRIWTRRDQIEERLTALCERIEKVIQMYLRNEYATITEYNEQAGSVAEKYHFLVVADFPSLFSELAAQRLQSIVTSGPRCGIFTLIHWDLSQALPAGFIPDELRKNSVNIRRERGALMIDKDLAGEGVELILDSPPEPELAMKLVHRIGKCSIGSNRVEVPFSQVAPPPEEMWRSETTDELRIAIGRAAAARLQYFAIGKGTRQHALIAGKTGSGKSTLFHVLITNLALACSPSQVEFYLIDFKKGVEFKCYAEKRLPHARVIAIESDREFALSVLQRVDAELRRRGDLFRQLGVQDIPGYKKAGGAESIPRLLLIIDEFQEFFVEDDSVAHTASMLLDRLVRQGRAFGIHVLLGSQTLGGAYTLARTTLGQMVIRIALQCNESDAYLIMDDNNSAPRLLSRPGEGIYNDAAGAFEGNSPFQVVWLPDDERDKWLDKTRQLANQHQDKSPAPIVFEGNVPADVRQNELLRTVLSTAPTGVPSAARIWLGSPNSIKGPTEVVFRRQSGSHLLIVGQREESALVMLGLSLIALAAQYPAGTARFIFLDGTNPDSPESDFVERVVAAASCEVKLARGLDVERAMDEIANDMRLRSGNERPDQTPEVFLFVHSLHKQKKLRYKDDFDFSMSSAEAAANPGAQFNDLICEGSAHGMHVLTTVDTGNNVTRFLSRKGLGEFGMRVVFQMSANDSAMLIDSPKAGELGLYRALLFSEHEGFLETFRPYAMPEPDWIQQAAAALSKRRT